MYLYHLFYYLFLSTESGPELEETDNEDESASLSEDAEEENDVLPTMLDVESFDLSSLVEDNISIATIDDDSESLKEDPLFEDLSSSEKDPGDEEKHDVAQSDSGF